MENYSLGDIKSVIGDNGFDGGSAWVILLLFFFCFGGNGFGYGRNNDVATATGMNFDSISKQINQIGDGIASLGYNQLQTSSNNTAAINGNIVTEGRAIQTQLAEMCCANKESFAATNAAIHAEAEATRALIQQNKIDMLQSKVAQLENANMYAGLQAQLNTTVKYPTATTYSSGSNPFCGCSCGNV